MEMFKSLEGWTSFFLALQKTVGIFCEKTKYLKWMDGHCVLSRVALH